MALAASALGGFRPFVNLTLLLGTVQSDLSVKLDGSETSVVARYEKGTVPDLGDRVVCATVGRSIYVLGIYE